MIVVDEAKGRSFDAPDLFERDVPDSHKPEKFTVDTTQFFAALRSEPSMLLRRCFGGSDGPSFYDGPGLLFNLRLAVLYFTGQIGPDAQLSELTPVGFSPDGRYALLHRTIICYGLCGSGVFYLFEKRGADWTLAGRSVDWIS